MTKGEQRQRQCRQKVRHATEDNAYIARRYLKQKFEDPNLNVYPCRYCHGWHVGHKKGTQRAETPATDAPSDCPTK